MRWRWRRWCWAPGRWPTARPAAAVHVVGLAVFAAASLPCGLAGDRLCSRRPPRARGSGRGDAGHQDRADRHQLRGRERATAFGVFGAVTGRPRPSARPRRGAHHRLVVALDLLREHPDRRRSRSSSRCGGSAESRDPGRAAARLAGRGELLDRPGTLLVLRAHPGPCRGGLGRARRWLGCEGRGGRAARPLRGGSSAGHPTPMFDLRLLRTPTFVGGLLAVFLLSSVSLAAVLVYLVALPAGRCSATSASRDRPAPAPPLAPPSPSRRRWSGRSDVGRPGAAG